MTALKDHERNTVMLSEEQFGKLVELLTPGYECSKLMLEELRQRDAERQRHEIMRAREQGEPAQNGEPAEQGEPDGDGEPKGNADPNVSEQKPAGGRKKTLDSLNGSLG